MKREGWKKAQANAKITALSLNMSSHPKTPLIKMRGLEMGPKKPIAIQSMTNTETADAEATATQAIELIIAGAELVRVTVDSDSAAKAIPKIREKLDFAGYKNVPLAGDFHFNGHQILSDNPECARVLDKYRINPGNVGFGESRDKNFEQIIRIAIENDKVVRIGVNGGSLDQELLREMMDRNAVLKNPKSDRTVFIEAMVESALQSAKIAEKIGLPREKIVLSVKMSDVNENVRAYQSLASKTKARPYCLHLGLTEAGSGIQGIVSSTAALSILLEKEIGDTIRVSLTPENTSRTEEVEVCKQILQSLGLRHFRPKITSCPGCGRSENTFFQKLAAQINGHIDRKISSWIEEKPAVKNLKIAVMGCTVNGPGESRHADIAISLPGKKETQVAPVYIKGKQEKVLNGPDIPDQFIRIIEDYIAKL